MGSVIGLDGCSACSADADRVAGIRPHIPSQEETDRIADWFRVLGDGTRARVLYVLRESGELCVCDLAEVVGASESTTSHALRWLRTAGMVRARRSGRRMFYALDDEHIRLLLDLTREHLRHQARPAGRVAAATPSAS